MTIDEIKSFTRSAAARPFLIRLTDGRSLEVSHPEFIAFPREEGTFVFFPPEGGLILVSLPQVVSVDIIAASKAADSSH